MVSFYLLHIPYLLYLVTHTNAGNFQRYLDFEDPFKSNFQKKYIKYDHIVATNLHNIRVHSLTLLARQHVWIFSPCNQSLLCFLRTLPFLRLIRNTTDITFYDTGCYTFISFLVTTVSSKRAGNKVKHVFVCGQRFCTSIKCGASESWHLLKTH